MKVRQSRLRSYGQVKREGQAVKAEIVRSGET